MDIYKNKIKDLIINPLTTRVDDRGYLIEIIRATDPFLKKFGQVYVVGSTSKGTIRAFHKHKKLWDYFYITQGSAKYAFYDDRKNSKTYKKMETFILTQRNPSLIIVPPGVYHGWMALEDNTILISTASEVYNREKPDEVRVPYNSFGYDWSIKFK
ncbi:dTDP-4-dehydrorhamnose 3,5-epimerase family protein [Candidatus Gottesmanbacteria bacterium]|nr:dTDP-4-dehydrorhamnose 3,5-epimerase family protein [Candidatus Gottesmanbacteria bacterium]